jgi:hypothetical protein
MIPVMKTSAFLLSLCLLLPSLPLAAQEDEEYEGAEAEQPAEEELPPKGPGVVRSAGKPVYKGGARPRGASVPVQTKPTAPTYAPAPVVREQEEEAEESVEEVPEPAPRAHPVFKVGIPGRSVAKPGGETSGSCGAVPKKVRTYTRDDLDEWFAAQCKNMSCENAVQLTHYLYPKVLTIGALMDFMERCDFRKDTPCPLSQSNYPNTHEANTISVLTELDAGGSIPEADGGVGASPPGLRISAQPIVGFSRYNRAFDISIPFIIDSRMKGRTFDWDYSENQDGPTGYQFAVSSCEGDFSKNAVLMYFGNPLKMQVLASAGMEGASKIKGTSTITAALKAGKKYYLNIRSLGHRFAAGKSDEVKNWCLYDSYLGVCLRPFDPHAATDSLPERALWVSVLRRNFLRDDKDSYLQFYRWHMLAWPEGNSQELSEGKVRGGAFFRQPGQSFDGWF